MKKVININFQGSIVPIEETAFDTLQKYISSLHRYFVNEEGKEEIINDIELRIAELFGERLKQGNACISDDDVVQIINSIGNPEDFDVENEPKSATSTHEQKYEQMTDTTGGRLYRDENHKILAGVCSGIANHFAIDPVIVRIIAIILFSIMWLPYIILWIVIPSSATQVIGAPRKRLFRDMGDKIVGGVCSGLARYFGINSWIPRVLFLIPFISFSFKWTHWFWGPDFPSFLSFTFSPAVTVVYIILWILVPEPKTAADKLEMAGKPVDLNNIKDTVQGDMIQFKDKAQKWGKDLKQNLTSTTSTSGTANAAQAENEDTSTEYKFTNNPTNATSQQPRRGLGYVLLIILKIFLGFWLLIIVGILFSIGVGSLGFLALKPFFITGPIQNILLWTAYVCLIWAAIIGLIVWFIRKVSNKSNNKAMLRGTSISLWAIGWVALITLFVLICKQYRYSEKTSPINITLSNPKVPKLIVREINNDHYDPDFDNFFHNVITSSDTLYLGNTKVKIETSDNDSFYLSAIRYSNGTSKSNARQLANAIAYKAIQVDSNLYLQRDIAINENDKFHNQQLVYVLKVPVGKHLVIKYSKYAEHNISIGNMSVNVYDANNNNYYDTDTEYVMTNEGLKPINDNQEDEWSDHSQDSLDIIEKRKELEENIKEQKEDLQRRKEDIDRQIKDLNDAGKNITFHDSHNEDQQSVQSSSSIKSTHYFPPISFGAVILSRFM